MSEGRTEQTTISSPLGDYDSLRFVSAETPCPYLPGRFARNEAYFVDDLDETFHERLLSRGFRRSGHVVYRPRCRSCQQCRSLRIPVNRFRLTRSMRRVAGRNRDVRVAVAAPVASFEKYAMFRRYLSAQHDEAMSRSYETFAEFLYDSPTRTIECCYYLGHRLIGVSLADRIADGLSSVYVYFDPDFSRRSPGTFSVLWEVDFCRRLGLSYYYLGYHVADCRKMAYKARFLPNEILSGDGAWLVFRE